MLGGALTALTLAIPSRSDEMTVRVGGARLSFDAARWTAVQTSPDAVTFSPHGRDADTLDAVEFRMEAGAAGRSCLDISATLLGASGYGASNLQPAPMTIGGLAAERYSAHTGCRNATPVGMIACVRAGEAAYLLSALQVGCRGRNLFSGIDPLAEIAGGVTWAK